MLLLEVAQTLLMCVYIVVSVIVFVLNVQNQLSLPVCVCVCPRVGVGGKIGGFYHKISPGGWEFQKICYQIPTYGPPILHWGVVGHTIDRRIMVRL